MAARDNLRDVCGSEREGDSNADTVEEANDHEECERCAETW